MPRRHQLLITEPIVGVGPEFPIARVVDANVYVRAGSETPAGP